MEMIAIVGAIYCVAKGILSITIHMTSDNLKTCI
jgi:hypothetical protein